MIQQRPKQAELLGKIGQQITGPADNRLQDIFRNRNINRTQRKQRNVIPTPVFSLTVYVNIKKGVWKPEFWTKLAGAEEAHQRASTSCLHVRQGRFQSADQVVWAIAVMICTLHLKEGGSRQWVKASCSRESCHSSLPHQLSDSSASMLPNSLMPSGLGMLATSLTETQEQRHPARVNLKRGTCSLPQPFKYAWWNLKKKKSFPGLNVRG